MKIDGEGHRFPDYGEAPDFFVSITEPGLAPQPARIVGTGLYTALQWLARDSIAGEVPQPVTYRSNYSSENLPDLLLNNSAHFVSSRLREVIEPWLKDFEFLSAEIELTKDENDREELGGAEVVGGYWWMNCWRRLDLIDWEQSKILSKRVDADSQYSNSTVRGGAWDELVLRAPIPSDEHFFEFEGLYGAWKVVSPQLQQALLAARLKMRFDARRRQRWAQIDTLEITKALNRPTL